MRALGRKEERKWAEPDYMNWAEPDDLDWANDPTKAQ